MIKQDSIDSILGNINLVSFLEQELSMKQVGRSYKALCPFHEETTPSFIVNPEKGLYHCFGCGKGGNAINYLREKGYSFVEAMEILSNYTGIPLEQTNSTVNKKEQRLLEIIEIAHSWYQEQLSKNQSFLDARQLYDIAKKYQLGYAPLNLGSLLLRLKNYSDQELKQCGIKSFRNRLMFPLHDTKGNVIGFSGRRIGDNDKYAKYINSPTSSIYQKDKVLNGFYQSQKLFYSKKTNPSLCYEEKSIILTEGTIDTYRLLSYNIPVIGTLSTHLSAYQKVLIEKNFDSIILCFDSDKAGLKAITELVKQKWAIPVFVLQVPKEKDIDAFILSQGIKSFISLLDDKLDKVNWYLDYLFSCPHNKATEFKALLKDIQQLYYEGLSSDEQLFYFNLFINKISTTLNLPKNKVEELLRKKDANSSSLPVHKEIKPSFPRETKLFPAPSRSKQISLPSSHTINVNVSREKEKKKQRHLSNKDSSLITQASSQIKTNILERFKYRQTFETCIGLCTDELMLFIVFRLEDDVNQLTMIEDKSPYSTEETLVLLLELGKIYLNQDKQEAIQAKDVELLNQSNRLLAQANKKLDQLSQFILF